MSPVTPKLALWPTVTLDRSSDQCESADSDADKWGFPYGLCTYIKIFSTQSNQLIPVQFSFSLFQKPLEFIIA